MVQSIAGIVWRNAKQKRENSGLNFVKILTKVLSGLKCREGEGRKSSLSQNSCRPSEEVTQLWD